MKFQIVLLLLSALTAVKPLKFLMIPGPAVSHCLETLSIGRELLSRGHHVTLFVYLFDHKPCVTRWLITSEKFKVVSPNIDPDVKKTHESIFRSSTKTLFQSSSRLMFAMTKIKPMVSLICKAALSDRYLLDQLQKDDYDMALIEGLPFTSCLFAVAVHLEIPYAAISSLFDPVDTGMPLQANILPHFLSSFNNKMNFFERFFNTMIYVLSPAIKRLMMASLDLSTYSDKLQGKDSRFLIKDSVLFIENGDYFFDYPKAVLPNYIQAGGLTATPSNSLPSDVQDFMDEAKEGIILVTFGSVLKDMPSEVVDKVMESLHKLQQKVILKHDRNGVSGNVRTMKWVPQNDILGHPNVRLFISHCGKNGLWESVYHGVPIVCTPFGTDAVSTGIKVKTHGVGTSVNIIDITSEELVSTLNSVLSNETFYENMRKMSAILRERPETPAQRAASALEHVVKFGADHMKPVDTGFLSFIHAEFWLSLLFIFMSVYVAFFQLVWFCCWRDSKKQKTE